MVNAASTEALAAVMDVLPPRSDLVVNPLAVVLASDLVERRRRLATANPAAYEPDLAMSLNNLSIRLAEAGRQDESDRARTEATEVQYRVDRRRQTPTSR
ncbi:MAG: hypothetical protein ACR2HM_02670 [Acidimicrobiales bacterium]